MLASKPSPDSLATNILQLCQLDCHEGRLELQSKGGVCKLNRSCDMIRIAVCDDERPVRESIVKALGRYKDENNTEMEVLEFASADSLLTCYPDGVDLILLDIYMPGIDGMDAARAIRKFDSEVCIIFITTMYQRAIEGYKVRAFGFIRKPVSYEEFSHEISDAINNIEHNRSKDHVITVKSGSKSYRVPVSKISYCEVRGHYISMCIDGEIKEYRCPIRELEEQLGGYGFFRCHASFLVSADAIKEIRQTDILLKDGSIVPISQRKRKAFMSALSEFLGDRI